MQLLTGWYWNKIGSSLQHTWDVVNLGNIKAQMTMSCWSFAPSVHARSAWWGCWVISSPSRPHLTTTTSQLAMQRSVIIDRIAQGILGNGIKRGTNAVCIKEVHGYTFKRAYHTFFNLQHQRAWGWETSIRRELASCAGRFHYLGNWKGCLTKKKEEGMTFS